MPPATAASITSTARSTRRGSASCAVGRCAFRSDGTCSTFSASVGVDDESARAVASFQVCGDGVKVYDSGVMNPPPTAQSVNVNVTGMNELQARRDRRRRSAFRGSRRLGRRKGDLHRAADVAHRPCRA